MLIIVFPEIDRDEITGLITPRTVDTIKWLNKVLKLGLKRAKAVKDALFDDENHGVGIALTAEQFVRYQFNETYPLGVCLNIGKTVVHENAVHARAPGGDRGGIHGSHAGRTTRRRGDHAVHAREQESGKARGR